MVRSTHPTLGAPVTLDAVQAPENHRFLEAWLGWRGPDRLLPLRSAIELSDIKELLGMVALCEIVRPDEIRIKVAGSRLRDHANFEATGRNYADITPPALWPIRRYRMTAMATFPCGGAMTILDTQTVGQGVSFEIVTLPVEADAPEKPPLLISNLVAASAFEDPVAGRPPLVPLVDAFCFLDIGAGTPETTEP